MRIGQRVRLNENCTVKKWIGREGTITSFGNAVLPVHVTLDGENYETDFKENELEAL